MNEQMLGFMVNVAPLISLFMYFIAVGYSCISGLISLTSVRVCLCLGVVVGHVPLVEFLFLRTSWYDRIFPYIHKAWSALPYLLFLTPLFLLWVFLEQKHAGCSQWVRFSFFGCIILSALCFTSFVMGLRCLAAV